MKVIAGSSPRYIHVRALHLLCQKLRNPYVAPPLAPETVTETTLPNWRANIWIDFKQPRFVPHRGKWDRFCDIRNRNICFFVKAFRA
jgi:hypothetical protein